MTNVKPATDEEIAKWRISVPIEPFYGSVWICKGCAVRWDANEYESIPHMDYCLSELGPRIKARLEADREEIASLKADQADWRKGVGFIAAALGIDSLSCVDIAERGLEIRAERDALKAEVETLRGCLHDLAATVRGEAPSLLNEDSGGDAFLSMRIDAALGTGRAR